MTLPFHALANIFPLIEGAEFDELVASIRENGQREAIVLYEGAILDGRNRYRACIAAGVDARMEEFRGTDPVKFVVDINVRRRHLNESQRALVAAKIANLLHGTNQFAVRAAPQQEDVEISPSSPPAAIAPVTTARAAEIMNVDRHTVSSARKVLSEGTAEEISACEKGDAAVSTIAREIRAKKSPDDRKRARDAGQSNVGKNPQRIETQRLNAQVWGHVRDGLTALSSLPLPVDVVSIVRAHDRTGLVDTRLAPVLEWLQEFRDAWCNSDQNRREKENEATGNHHADAGAGDRAA